jgi:hypothetical protein
MKKSFNWVQNHFTHLNCQHCEATFQPDGIELVREEALYWVVRVNCNTCSKNSGIAIVGVEHEPDVEVTKVVPPGVVKPGARGRYTFNSKAERERLNTMGPISKDEVLDVHCFLKNWDGVFRLEDYSA